MNGGIEAILGELIEAVQAVAPALWATAQRQVLANTVGNAVWGAVFFLAAVVLGLVAYRNAKQWAKESVRSRHTRRDDFTPENAMWVASVFATILFIISIVYLNVVLAYTINPDYYAIKVLLGLVR